LVGKEGRNEMRIDEGKERKKRGEFFCLETEGLTLASRFLTCEDILVRRQTGSG